MTQPKRNDPCPCGSGKKYKKCCALKTPMQRRSYQVLTQPEQSGSEKMGGVTSLLFGNMDISSQSVSLSDRVSGSSGENQETLPVKKEDLDQKN